LNFKNFPFYFRWKVCIQRPILLPLGKWRWGCHHRRKNRQFAATLPPCHLCAHREWF